MLIIRSTKLKIHIFFIFKESINEFSISKHDRKFEYISKKIAKILEEKKNLEKLCEKRRP